MLCPMCREPMKEMCEECGVFYENARVYCHRPKQLSDETQADLQETGPLQGSPKPISRKGREGHTKDGD